MAKKKTDNFTEVDTTALGEEPTFTSMEVAHDPVEANPTEDLCKEILDAVKGQEPVCLTPVLEAIDKLATAICDIKPVPEEGFFNPQKLLDKEEYQELCGHCEYRREG